MKRRQPSKPRCRCSSSGVEVHVKGCRISRPQCRVMRARSAKHRVCYCGCYHFPHRNGSKYCRLGIPMHIAKSRSWRIAASAAAGA